MAKQINKTFIGGFVISTIAILVAGVILLGGGGMFKQTYKYVMFFEHSVKGLSVGAPVVWSGVEVGSVHSIVLEVDFDNLSAKIAVIIETDPSRMIIEGTRSPDARELVKSAIVRGLRAELALQSMVTGQMMIELDYFPDTPARLTGFQSEYPEIPTKSSSMGMLTQKIRNLPIGKIAAKLLSVLDNIEKVTGDSKLQEILSNINTASQNLNTLILNTDSLIVGVDASAKQVLDNLVTASSDAQKFLVDARKLVKNTDSQVQPLSQKAQDAMVSTEAAMDQAKNTLVSINDFVDEYADSRQKLNRALDEIAAAAQSVDSLADYIERHPEAILRGKGSR